MRDIVLEVLTGFGSAKCAESVFGSIVEGIVRNLAQDQVEINAGFLVRIISDKDFLAC